MLKEKKIRSAAHLRFIRSLPCCVTLSQGVIQAAHIRGGTDGGTSLKPSDNWTVPLDAYQHHLQHTKGEKSYWPDLDRVRELALSLYRVTGDADEGMKLVTEYWRENYECSRTS